MLLKNTNKENQAPENLPQDIPKRFKRLMSLKEKLFFESSILLHLLYTPTCNAMSPGDFSVMLERMKNFTLKFHSPYHWKEGKYYTQES